MGLVIVLNVIVGFFCFMGCIRFCCHNKNSESDEDNTQLIHQRMPEEIHRQSPPQYDDIYQHEPPSYELAVDE